VASIVITVGIVYTAQRGGLKLVPESGDFSGVHWWAIGLYLPLLLLNLWFRSVRWRYLLRSIVEIPKRRLFAVSCAGFLAILLIPFRLGELVRPYMLKSRPGDGTSGRLTMTAATSSVIAERVADGLFLSVVLALVLVLVPTIQPLPDHVIGLPLTVAQVRTSAYVMLGLFVTAFTVLAVFYFARSWAHRATMLIIGRISPRLAEKLTGLFEKLAEGLHVFGRGRDALGFFVETAVYWLLNALGMWVLAWGVGVVHADGSTISFAETCGLMGMLGCTIMIPGPPGLLGVFQAGVYAGLTMYVPTQIVTGPGAAYVFLLYITQVATHVVTGSWGLVHEGGASRLRGALGAPIVDVEPTT
jgi:uncharacterized protein (TIRG00374 family)